MTTALGYGGAEQQVTALARELKRRDWAVQVISMLEPTAHVAELVADDIDVVSLRMRKGVPDPRALWRLRGAINRFRPDIVHSHMYHANLLTRFARPWSRTSILINTAHNIDEGHPIRNYRFTDRLSDLTTNVSRAAARHYRERRAAPPPKLWYVPNGIDPEPFEQAREHRSAMRRALELGPDQRVVLHIGRFDEQKNHRGLIKAFTQVHSSLPDAVLLLVGAGPLADEVAGEIRRAGLEQHVRLLGERTDIPQLMAAADVFALPSHFEGLPITLLEAAASGLPSVATDVGGNSEIVRQGETGLLVPPEDMTAFGDALIRLLRATEIERARMGRAGQQLVGDRYAIEAVADRWIAIYERQISGAASRGSPVAQPAASDASAGSGARLLSDSTMWQSRRWATAVDSVHRFSGGRVANHPLAIALRLFLRRNRYEAVLTTGNASTLIYGLLCLLTRREPNQVVAQLYLNERSGLFGLLHDPLMRAVLRRAHGVIISSRPERPIVEGRFGVPADRMRFVPYHTTVIHPERTGCNGPIFAGGLNFRDYETLLDAVEPLGAETVIVCGRDQLRERAIPDHVTVLRDIPWHSYLHHLRRSGIVVLPLSTERVPAGQVALLEAMALGKPTVTTRQIGTVDYVEDGVTGLLCEVGNAEDLLSKLQMLINDEETRKSMGDAAYRRVMSDYSFDVHVDAKLNAIHQLAGLCPDPDLKPDLERHD